MQATRKGRRLDKGLFGCGVSRKPGGPDILVGSLVTIRFPLSEDLVEGFCIGLTVELGTRIVMMESQGMYYHRVELNRGPCELRVDLSSRFAR